MSAPITVSRLRTDGGTQPRADLSDETVAEYRDAMVNGTTFPPVVVFYDGTDHWLADGFHRLAAAKETGAKEISADIRPGTQRDAILHSVGANGAHGLRRTNADKRRAVERLLADEEWSRWSDRKIADACGVTHPFVGKVRAELAGGNRYHSRELAPYPCPSSWTLPDEGELLARPWECVTARQWACVAPSRRFPGFVYVAAVNHSDDAEENSLATFSKKPIRADAAWMFLEHLRVDPRGEWTPAGELPDFLRGAE
jgi:hypothetical protein